jgi:mono/diheme cytochrome c family protein
MAERTTMMDPLQENEQRQVTAYLVAISPVLRKSAQQLRQEQDRRDQSQQAAAAVASEQVEPTTYNPSEAKQLFLNKCSQCHKLNVVDESPPGSEKEARELVSRMVDEGLEATEEELAQIVKYLAESYAHASE